ncbi:unnamed protein product [Lymnaea stagnalis]|uniref:Uncharacterized protein n=1 Tax=Lymnaea stagnalis TaxID=6523 RepID=A0AAV2I8G1_LYMST
MNRHTFQIWPRTTSDVITHSAPTMTTSYVPLVPNNLARPPMQWTAPEVKAWLKFCVEEFSLSPICVDKFDMNGKALCLLTRKDFMERSPHAGDVLYNAFQRHRQHEGLEYQGTVFTSPQIATANSHSNGLLGVSQPHGIRQQAFISILPQLGSNISDTSSAETLNNSQILSKKEDGMPQGVPTSMLSPAPSEKGASDSDSCNNDHGQSPQNIDLKMDDDSICDVAFDPSNPNEDGVCRLLWEFIYQLLQDKTYTDLVCWESADELMFRINNPTKLAEFWGQQKNRSNMTYEKLSRALRYYYKMEIIKKVPGKRLTYQFLQHPTKIRKGQRGARPHSSRGVISTEDETAARPSISNDSSTFAPTLRPSSSPSSTKSPAIPNDFNNESRSPKQLQVYDECEDLQKTCDEPNAGPSPNTNSCEPGDREASDRTLSKETPVSWPSSIHPQLCQAQIISENNSNICHYPCAERESPCRDQTPKLFTSSPICHQLSLSGALFPNSYSPYSCNGQLHDPSLDVDGPPFLNNYEAMGQHRLSGGHEFIKRSSSLSPPSILPKSVPPRSLTPLLSPNEAHARPRISRPYPLMSPHQLNRQQAHSPNNFVNPSHYYHHQNSYHDSFPHDHCNIPVRRLQFSNHVMEPKQAHLPSHPIKHELCEDEPEDLSMKPADKRESTNYWHQQEFSSEMLKSAINSPQGIPPNGIRGGYGKGSPAEKLHTSSGMDAPGCFMEQSCRTSA